MAGALRYFVAGPALTHALAATGPNTSSEAALDQYLNRLIAGELPTEHPRVLLSYLKYHDSSFKSKLSPYIEELGALLVSEGNVDKSQLIQFVIKLQAALRTHMEQPHAAREEGLPHAEQSFNQLIINISTIARAHMFGGLKNIVSNLGAGVPETLFLTLHKKLARLEMGKTSGEDSPTLKHLEQLDALITLAIAVPQSSPDEGEETFFDANSDPLEERVASIKAFLENTPDIGLENIEEKKRALEDFIEERTDNCLRFLIELQKEIRAKINSDSVVTKIAQETQVIFKKQFSLQIQALLTFIEGWKEIPQHISLKLRQILARLECNEISMKDAMREFAQTFETLEVRVQDINISKFFLDLLKQTEEEVPADVLPPVEPRSPPALPMSAEIFKATIQEQKQQLIENTSLFLIFKLVHDALLPKKTTTEGDVEDDYLSALALSLVEDPQRNSLTRNQRLKEILMAKFLNESSFKRFLAHVLWGIASIVISKLISNLCNHHLDTFFSTYISSENPKMHKDLLKEIIFYLNRYLVVLDGAYRRVARQTHREEDVQEAVVKEIEHPSSYGGFTRDKLYARMIRYEIEVALGGSLAAKITSFVLDKMFSWHFAPKLRDFVDSKVESLITSEGYPHTTNLIFQKQLKQLKASLQDPSFARSTTLKPLSVHDRNRIRDFIKKLVEIVHPNKASSQQELEAALQPTTSYVKDSLYKHAIESATDFASSFIQTISKDQQLGRFFLELLHNMNQAYQLKDRAGRTEEAETHEEVKRLTKEVMDLSVDKFVTDLDLLGEQEQTLVNLLIHTTKRAIEAFISTRQEEIRGLQLESASEDNLRALVVLTENINTSLKDLSTYPRIKQEHKEALKKLNEAVFRIQGALMRKLECMADIVFHKSQFEKLEGLTTILTQQLEALAPEGIALEDLNFAEMQRSLEECKISPPASFSSLPQKHKELQTSCQKLQQINELLENSAEKEQEILTILRESTFTMDVRTRLWLRQMESALAARRAPPQETERSGTFAKVRQMTGSLAAAAMIPFRARTAPLEPTPLTILDQLLPELRKQQVNVQELTTKLKTEVAGYLTEVVRQIDVRKQAVAPNNPGEAFNHAKDRALHHLNSLHKCNQDILIPITFYNVPLVQPETLKDCAVKLIEAFGGDLIPGLISLSGRNLTYTHGVIPHVVIPILNP